MDSKKTLYIFISIAVAITVYLTYRVFEPFLSPLLMGIIFSIAFHPAYLKLLEFAKGRKALASLGTCLLVTVIIIIPLIYIATVFVGEATYAYSRFDEVLRSGKIKELFPFWDNPSFQSVYKRINLHLEALQIDIKAILINNLKEIGTYIVQLATGMVTNLAVFLLDIILMLFAMFYLLRDSDIVAAAIKDIMPIRDAHRERIFSRLKDIIYATMYGTIAAASAQGFLGWLGFWALGISSPVLWGVVMGLLAIVPVLGAFFVWAPASLILLVQGSYIKAGILFLWGGLVIGLVDNLIWPLLVSGRAMLHPLVAFFSMLGGIVIFGPIGLFVGPFIVALLLILIDIQKELERESA